MDTESPPAGHRPMLQPERPVALVLSDVDGTLVTKAKLLTPRAVAAVAALQAAGVKFAVTSSRPPLGLRGVAETLKLTTPLCGCNGGLITEPDGHMLLSRSLPPAAARRVVDILRAAGVLPWVFTPQSWLVLDPAGPHVERETRTLGFGPQTVADFGDALDHTVKLVGASHDHAGLQACEVVIQQEFGPAITAARSQPYYLDITHPQATKGDVVRYLSDRLGIPTAAILTIGDMDNDVSMFGVSGFSVAMGNATAAVHARASAVTDSNEEDGFAKAMARYVLMSAD